MFGAFNGSRCHFKCLTSLHGYESAHPITPIFVWVGVHNGVGERKWALILKGFPPSHLLNGKSNDTTNIEVVLISFVVF